jgi:hypothetical protein
MFLFCRNMLKKKTAAEFFERNLNDCCQLVRTMQLSDFLPQSRPILDVFQNYRRAYGLNDTAFFLTSLTAIGHFGNNSATYCQTSNICTKSSLFLVIVGPSGTSAYSIVFLFFNMFPYMLKCNREMFTWYLN